jgi:integrase
LTKPVLELIAGAEGEYLFSDYQGGSRPFSGFSRSLERLNRNINAIRKAEGRKPIAHWSYHDLRRTARTLMSRAGVSTDTAERVLGHVLGGMREVYDRHSYLEEKREALERLAALVGEIISPTPAGKVVKFAKKKAA